MTGHEVRGFYGKKKTTQKTEYCFSSIIVIIAIAWGIFTKAGSDPNGSQFIKDVTGNSNDQVTNTIKSASKAIRSMAGYRKAIIKS